MVAGRSVRLLHIRPLPHGRNIHVLRPSPGRRRPARRDSLSDRLRATRPGSDRSSTASSGGPESVRPSRRSGDGLRGLDDRAVHRFNLSCVGVIEISVNPAAVSSASYGEARALRARHRIVARVAPARERAALLRRLRRRGRHRLGHGLWSQRAVRFDPRLERFRAFPFPTGGGGGSPAPRSPGRDLGRRVRNRQDRGAAHGLNPFASRRLLETPVGRRNSIRCLTRQFRSSA
jgi:hypothetical protein